VVQYFLLPQLNQNGNTNRYRSYSIDVYKNLLNCLIETLIYNNKSHDNSDVLDEYILSFSSLLNYPINDIDLNK